MFENKVVVITGGAKGIGKAIAQQFQEAGARVCTIDLLPGDYYTGDLGEKTVLEDFARKVIGDYGHVDYLINNALPLMKGIDTCSYEEFNYALRVGVSAPFYLSKLFAPYFAPGAAIVNISSSRDRMSQPQTESYTAAKGGISALTHALAVSLAGKVRVNSISPAGLIRITPSMKARTPASTQLAGWEILWTLPIWCSTSARTRQDLSPARISASMAA